jgi:ATP-dependent helicase IRC3
MLTPNASAPTLRPYQGDQLQAIADSWSAGTNRVLIKSPTGTGKTVTFAAMPRFPQVASRLAAFPQRGAFMLVIAHREELLTQAAAKLQAANPKLIVDIEMADNYASRAANIIVASIQTLAAVSGGRKFSRLLRLMRDHTFRLVIVDEAHHSAAASYRTALVHLGFLPAEDASDVDNVEAPDYDDVALMQAHLGAWDKRAPQDRMLVGFTATPTRSDAIGLGCVFQSIAYSYALKQAIDDGWLVPITPWVVESNISLDDVAITAGDFNQKQLAAAVNQSRRNDLAVAAWRDHGEDRQTLAFTVDVAHAHDVAAAFQAAGTPALAISGETPKPDRRQALEAYRNRRVRLLANCMVLTEGTDLPETGCILHLKPTKSATLYEQMTGRGLRLFDGKEDCLVIDLVDVAKKHSLQTAPVLYGLPPGLVVNGESLDQAESDLEAFKEQHPTIDVEELLRTGRLTLAQLQARATTFDIWKIPSLGALEAVVSLNWIKQSADRFKLSYPWGDGYETIEVGPDLLGKFEIALTMREKQPGGMGYDVRQRTLANGLQDAATALRAAEAWVGSDRRTIARLRSREAPWRSRPASPGQLGVLRKLRVPFSPSINSGQASDMIDMARQRTRR